MTNTACESALAPMQAAPLSLSKRASVDDAVQAVLENCLAQVTGNAAGVLAAADPECLHQMRVGLRRLRSALHVFAEAAPMPALMQEELKWLGTALGEARDWEVLASETMSTISAANAGAGSFILLPKRVADIAAEKRAAVVQDLKSARYRHLIQELQSWLQFRKWHQGAGLKRSAQLKRSIEHFARRAVASAHRHVMKRGRHIGKADISALHKLRIAAKRSRYAAEYFQSLYRPKGMRRYIMRLAALQDILGRRNDASVAQELIRKIEPLEGESGLSIEVARAMRLLVSQADSGRQRMQKIWRRFVRCKTPW